MDFTAGIAVNALGHNHPVVTKAIRDAADFIHISNLYHHPFSRDFADILVSKSWDAEGKVFFCNSGTEANEAAIKIGRKYGKSLGKDKINILSFERGNAAFFNHAAFHGRSMGSLSATPAPKYQKPFFPLVPGFQQSRFNAVKGIYLRVIRVDSINAINEETCLVLVEPIQGEGGIHSATIEFLHSLRQRCNETGALLAFDEIQVKEVSYS